MVKFSSYITSLGIVFTLYIVIVSSSPKPFLLINKGQINVRDSVQRLGHVHSRSSGGRSKYFDFLGNGFMAREGRETDFSGTSQPQSPAITTDIEADRYSKGDNSDDPEIYSQPVDSQARSQQKQNPKANTLAGGGYSKVKATVNQHQQTFKGNQALNQQPEGYNGAIDNRYQYQQQGGEIQGQNQSPGGYYNNNYGQQPNFNYGRQPAYRPSINPLNQGNVPQEQVAIGSYGAHVSNGKRRGLKGLIHGIRGRLINTIDNVKRVVRTIMFKREKPAAALPNGIAHNRHYQLQQQPQFQQGNYVQANHGDIQKLEGNGGSNNNNYYYVSGASGHQRRRGGFLWDRDRERRCPRWLRFLCPLA